MSLTYENLIPEVRSYIAEEIDRDIQTSQLNHSSWLNENGLVNWSSLLREAALNGDDTSLAKALRYQQCLKTNAMRRKKDGGTSSYKLPATAPETLAEVEFNRYHMRGLCVYAVKNGINKLLVYRAKAVNDSRPSSDNLIGQFVDPQEILMDLRQSIGGETKSGLGAPNSGITLKIPA